MPPASASTCCSMRSISRLVASHSQVRFQALFYFPLHCVTHPKKWSLKRHGAVGKGYRIGHLVRNGSRWIELKDQTLPTRSSRPSQGEGEICLRLGLRKDGGIHRVVWLEQRMASARLPRFCPFCHHRSNCLRDKPVAKIRWL